MTSDGQPIERLRQYLRTLSPAARSMLLEELERDMSRGEENAGNELILQELRRAIRADARSAPRMSDAERLFFAPLEPFIIEAPADHKRIGRIARISLDPIWAWLARDLIPAELKSLSEAVGRALAGGDRGKADQVVQALHERAIARMRETIAATRDDEKASRRLGVQAGTPRALDDLSTMVAILSQRDGLADLSRRLPGHIRSFDREQIGSIKARIDGLASQCSSDDGGARRADIYLYGLILVMNRLAAPWQLLRFGVRAADSDDTARIAETPYAMAVTLVLSETRNLVGELRAELKSGRPIVSMLKTLHDAARGLRSELDLSSDSPWARQLAAIRADVSGLLKAEIETTPGCVRRILRPRPAKEIAPGSILDSLDVAEAENRVDFVCACRLYASELAVNEVTTRAHSELTLYLETGTKVLLDSLRHAGDADRPFRQSQVEAAVRLCRSVFGADYAGLLAKAAEVAVHTAANERKRA